MITRSEESFPLRKTEVEDRAEEARKAGAEFAATLRSFLPQTRITNTNSLRGGGTNANNNDATRGESSPAVTYIYYRRESHVYMQHSPKAVGGPLLSTSTVMNGETSARVNVNTPTTVHRKGRPSATKKGIRFYTLPSSFVRRKEDRSVNARSGLAHRIGGVPLFYSLSPSSFCNRLSDSYINIRRTRKRLWPVFLQYVARPLCTCISMRSK